MGGVGMPEAVWKACAEYLVAANPSLSLYSMLTMGACHLLHAYGKGELLEQMLSRLVTGEWGGTMCLTEPIAGSDVGALRTKAIPQDDGTYRIVGQKIWISSGDHDLCDNIVHTVLARIEGDPAGTEGISIFAVPKILVDEDGKILGANDVQCAGLEHKMGIRGSATCTMQFGDNNQCVGYLLGAPRSGMAIMFEMMNAARLEVGLQGLAVSSTAYRHAARYAQDRIQGQNPEDRNGPGVAIIHHADVKRMLLKLKSHTEAMRSLTLLAAGAQDRAAHGEKIHRQRYTHLLDFLIPLVKATNTDLAWDLTGEAIQIYGGYGFCTEYPMEQMARDCKIFSIYEGTNGIQSMDLLMRKILLNKDFQCLNAFRDFCVTETALFEDKELAASFMKKLNHLLTSVKKLGQELQEGPPNKVLAKAVPLQKAIRYFSLGLMQAMALDRLTKAKGRFDGLSREFIEGRKASAKYFLEFEFPAYELALSQVNADGNLISRCEPDTFR